MGAGGLLKMLHGALLLLAVAQVALSTPRPWATKSSGPRRSLDFLVSHDGFTQDRVQIGTEDWQEPCLGLDTSSSDVYMECSLNTHNGAPLVEANTYRNHCIYAEANLKAKACCSYCCAPLSRSYCDDAQCKRYITGEAEEYARTNEKRCFFSDVYCQESLLEAQKCDEALDYENELGRLSTYVQTNFLNFCCDGLFIADKAGQKRRHDGLFCADVICDGQGGILSSRV